MLTLTTNDLERTATYAKRSYAWVSTGTGEVVIKRTGEVIPGLGLLTIKLQKAETGWGRAIEVDTYAVDEVEPEEFGTRLFVLLNTTDPEQPEPYRVTVGGTNRCRCMAGKCRVPGYAGTAGCKHRDAIADVIESGDL